MVRAGARAHTLAALAYVVLAVLYTWPLALRLGDRFWWPRRI